MASLTLTDSAVNGLGCSHILPSSQLLHSLTLLLLVPMISSIDGGVDDDDADDDDGADDDANDTIRLTCLSCC